MKPKLDSIPKFTSSFGATLFYLLAMVITTLFYVFYKHGFTFENMRYPLTPYGDGIMYAATVRNLTNLEFPVSGKFGAPFGQDLSFSMVSVDLFAPLVAAVLVLSVDDLFLGINLLYALGFPLAALSAFSGLRLLGVSRAFSAISGTIIALFPYHAWWNTSGLTLSTYFLLPLAIALVVLMASPIMAHQRLGGRWSRKSQIAYLFLALTGASYSYWAFGLAFVVCVSLIFAFRDSTRESMTRLLSALASIITGFVVVALPSVIAVAQGPSINYLAERHFAAGVLNGTSFQTLFSFPEGTISGRVAALLFPGINQKNSLGVSLWVERGFSFEGFSTMTFTSIFLLGAAWLAFMFFRKADFESDSPSTQTLKVLFFLTPWIFLLSSAGGLGAVFSIYLSSALRGFSRFWILFAIILVFAVAVFLTAWLHKRRSKPISFALATLLILTLGDYFSVSTPVTSSTQFSPARPSNQVAQDAKEEEPRTSREIIEGFKILGSSLSQLPAGCDILSLPIAHYPYENPGYPSYRLLIPGLLDETFNWSAGATGGSSSFESLRQIRERLIKDPSSTRHLAKELGFCAVVLDEEVWQTLHYFRPWPEYQGHPEIDAQVFLERSSFEWEEKVTDAGSFFVLDLGALESAAPDS